MKREYLQFCIAALSVLVFLPGLRAQSARPGTGPIPYEDVSGTGTTFRVWAPNAASIEIYGDFNSWAGGDFLVNESNGYWSVDVEGAGHGDEFKYYLNSSFWKQDPRSRRVAGDNTVIYDPSRFDWGGDGAYVPPSKNDLVIYEMHPGIFYDPSPSDNYPAHLMDITQRLAYLADLGVNVIELMPVSEFPGERSWGYNPVDLYAVEAAYGGPDQLKALVKAAHGHGIAVYHDIVHNHYDSGSSECDLWEFDGWNGGPPHYGGIYFYQENGKCCTIWGRRPHYGRQGVQEFIRDNIVMWLDEYHLDGFRWDSPINMKFYDGNFNQEGYDLVRDINLLIQSNYPNHFSMGEDQNMDMYFDSEWHDSFHWNLIDQLTKANDADRNMYTIRDQVLSDGGAGHYRVIYSETHDKVGNLNNDVRLVKKLDNADPYSYTARKKAALAAVLTMTSPGIPLLFQGQEWFEDDAFNDWEALDWDQAASSVRYRLLYRRLIHLRRNLYGASAGLKGTGLDVFHVNDGAKVLAYHRSDSGGTNDDVVVAANFSSSTYGTYNIGFPGPGTWYEHFNSDWKLYSTDFTNLGVGSVFITNSWDEASIALAPYSAVIFSRSPVPPGDADGDGMLDQWETSNSLNSADAGDALLDPDGDGLTNEEEFERGLDPFSFSAQQIYDSMYLTGNMNNWDPDSEPMKLVTHNTWQLLRQVTRNGLDLKFIADGDWATAWGDADQSDVNIPLSGTADPGAEESPVYVADNLTSNLLDITFNETSLYYSVSLIPQSDADGDGMHDAWEVFYGLDTNSAADASQDPDGDSFSNLEEYQNGSAPDVFTEFLHDYNSMSCAGTFNNWSLSRAPMKLWENYGWETIINLVNETSVRLKFAGNSNWAFNWGDNNQSSTTLPLDQYADWQGGDITISDTMNGVFRFRFDQKATDYQVDWLPPKDSDGDGMHDDWEVFYGLNTNYSGDALDDEDVDGLNNLVEFEFGSDPRHVDSTRANYGSMSIAGTFSDWSPTNLYMDLVGHFSWQKLVVFTNTGTEVFKFAADGDWADNWGDNDPPGNMVPIDGVGESSGSDITCTVDRVGTYLFTFNDRTHQYSVEYIFASSYSTITLPGTFNGWDPTAYPMQLVDNNTWEVDVSLNGITNPAFKFVANQDWGTNWGETNQSGFTVPLSGTGELVGENIQVSQVLNGQYRFLFNDLTLAYLLEPVALQDSDGDGIPDSWEQLFGLNPTNASDASISSDGDAFSNLEEYLADTDPTNSMSYMRMSGSVPVSGGTVISWTGGEDVYQYLMQATDEDWHNWAIIFTNAPPTQVDCTYTNANPPSNAWYRIMTSPFPIGQ